MDSAFTRRCDPPVTLPERDLTDAEIERLWGRDRKNLVDCGARQRAHAEAAETRDSLIAGRARGDKL